MKKAKVSRVVSGLRSLPEIPGVRDWTRAFAGYFADWLEEKISAHYITASDYRDFITQTYSSLMVEDKEKFSDNDMKLLIHMLNGMNNMSEIIEKVFKGELVVKHIAGEAFYEEM